MRQATKYTNAIKASVLSKALAPNAPGVIELSKEFNIPKATIYTWMFNMKNKKEERVGIGVLKALFPNFRKYCDQKIAKKSLNHPRLPAFYRHPTRVCEKSTRSTG